MPAPPTDPAAAAHTLQILWRQWAAVGGAAPDPIRPARSVVDPEALLLASLWLAEMDRRLEDVAAAWVTVNSTLLSVQRVKNLIPAFPAGTSKRVSGMADVALLTKDFRWASVACHERQFPGGDSGITAAKPQFTHSATLMLQLRQGMGVGVKADILAWLLATRRDGRSWAGTAAITEALAYSAASVRRAADDLAAARFIEVPSSSPVRLYGVDPARWVAALGIGPIEPDWPDWRHGFARAAASVAN